MPSPFEYKEFRQFMISAISTSAIRKIFELTIFWLFALIFPPVLYGLAVSLRPILSIFLSPIGGYLSDKYGRTKPMMVSRIIASVLIIPLFYAFLIKSIILIFVIYYIRAFFQDLSNVFGTVLNFAVLPEDAREKALFYSRTVVFSFDSVTVILWPFIFSHLGLYTLLLGAVGYIISALSLIGLKVVGGSKDISISTGYKLFKKNSAAKGMILGIGLDQGAVFIVLNFMALIVKLFHGTDLDLALGTEGYTLSTIIGSYIMTRMHNPKSILITNVLLKFSIFPVFFLHNPLIVVYQGSAIAFADSIITNLYYVALRNASGKELLGSIMGFDELISNTSRTSMMFISGFLYSLSILYVFGLGMILMTASTVMYFKYKELMELKL